MAEKPIFKGIEHIAVVVKDLDEAMKRYWDEYGIGPWNIYTFDPSTVSDMIIRNERVDHAFRLAETKIGDVGFELIEPLDDTCVYAEFLKQHGEGLHHVGFAVDSCDEAMAFFRGKGIGVLHGGTWHGQTYTYLESEDTLSIIAELEDKPEGWESPTPEATYP
jgi:methylmalonyl-CoA/ethylmalonyl-CoA epimerase